MDHSPNSFLSSLSSATRDSRDFSMSAFGAAIGWTESDSSLGRFLRGTLRLHLDDAPAVVEGLSTVLGIRETEIWVEALGGMPEKRVRPHPLLTPSLKGRPWYTRVRVAHEHADQLAEMLKNARRTYVIARHVPWFLFPDHVLAEPLIGVLEDAQCRSGSILKAEYKFACQFQARLLEYGADHGNVVVLVPDESLRGLRKHATPYDTLTDEDVQVFRNELTTTWAPNRIYLTAVSPTKLMNDLLKAFQSVTVIDRRVMVAQPTGTFHRLLWSPNSETDLRCVEEHAQTAEALLQGIGYELNEPNVVRVLSEFLAA